MNREDHKTYIPGVGFLVTSWDGSESHIFPDPGVTIHHGPADCKVHPSEPGEENGEVRYNVEPGDDVPEPGPEDSGSWWDDY